MLVYGGVDIIACLGLSLEYGTSGVVNFGFIIYQAAGAYTAAVLSLPPDAANGGFQQYLGGLHLPFPLPWVGGALVGGLIAIPTGAVLRRKLQSDYAAIFMFVTAVILNTAVTNYRPLFNGAAGLALVPAPLSGKLNPEGAGYQWLYSIATIALCVAVYLFLRKVTESPYGRSLRAMRENDLAAASIGKDIARMRMTVLVLGGAVAGLSGAVLVGFINLWAPSAWTYPETIVLFAALIVGGSGNHLGAALGAVLVPLGFLEITRFIPPIGPPDFIPAMQWVVIGLLILTFLWFRPQGVLPERRRRPGRPPAPEAAETHLATVDHA